VKPENRGRATSAYEPRLLMLLSFNAYLKGDANVLTPQAQNEKLFRRYQGEKGTGYVAYRHKFKMLKFLDSTCGSLAYTQTEQRPETRRVEPANSVPDTFVRCLKASKVIAVAALRPRKIMKLLF
jgi:hypothetical protein